MSLRNIQELLLHFERRLHPYQLILHFRPSTPKSQVIVTPEHESQVPGIVHCAEESDLDIRTRSGGLVYSELATGVPSIFSHFVTNLPAFHNVLVFVCVKSVPVPYVAPEERFVIGRICPRSYRMYRCIVRYGYKDLQGDDGNFENLLIQSIAEFIQMEAVGPQFATPDSVSYDGRMAVISSHNSGSSNLIVSNEEEFAGGDSIQSSKSLTLQSLRSAYDEENRQIRRRRVRFQLPESPAGIDPAVREELAELIEAKEAGVAYIMGHSYSPT